MLSLRFKFWTDIKSNLCSISFSGSNDESIPKSIEFPIQLGFDKSFYNYFNKNSSRASQYIKEVVELSSELFSQSSSKLPVISWAYPNLSYIVLNPLYSVSNANWILVLLYMFLYDFRVQIYV